VRAILASLLVLSLACATSRGGLRGDAVGARRDLARALVAHGDLGGALSVLQPLLAERPRDAEALTLRGTVYREKGLLAEAAADLEEALRLDDELAAAHAAMGILKDLQLETKAAEEHHRRAVELEPRSPRYLNNLAFSLFAHGRARDAIPLYVEAVRYDPTNPRLRNNLGFAYAVTGDWPRARRQFEVGGSPSSSRLNLAIAYERAGIPSQALALYREVARLDPESRPAREGLERLAPGVEKPAETGGAGKTGAAAPQGGGP
jgi:Flp pilus assembly protein TadD